MEPAKRIVTVRRGKYLVEVSVGVVFSPEAPDEPMIDPDSASLLDEVARRAESGDVAWLKQHGRVFELVQA